LQPSLLDSLNTLNTRTQKRNINNKTTTQISNENNNTSTTTTTTTTTTSTSISNLIPISSQEQKKSFTCLRNLGSTCYINCIIQVMRYTPGFVSSINRLSKQIDYLKTMVYHLYFLFLFLSFYI
jgi:ubiquitin C-terminal hydrolase